MDDAHHTGNMQHAAALFFEWAAPKLAVRYVVMIQAALDAENWEETIPELLRRAAARLRRTNGFVNPHGMTEHDIAQEAVLLVSSGKRHWYRANRKKPMLSFLLGIVDSMTSVNHAKKEDLTPHLAVMTDPDKQQTGTCGEWLLPGEPADQEEKIIAEEKVRQFAAKLPPKVREYALVRASGSESAADCAAALETSESDVRNRHKLLKRRRSLWDNH
jgi:DNA-directed RNA polymerase specialized sigma24 family protein